MPDTTPIAAPPKRRWYQYSLRTLFIVVTLLAISLGYVGYNYQIVAERERLAYAAIAVVPSQSLDDNDISGIRRWIGDKSYLLIGLDNRESDATVQKYRDNFPEAKVVRMEGFDRAHSELVRAGKADWLPTPAL